MPIAIRIIIRITMTITITMTIIIIQFQSGGASTSQQDGLQGVCDGTVFFYQNKINRHYLVKISNIYVNVNVTLITDNNAFHQNYFEYNDTYGVDDDYYHFDHDEDGDDNG